MATKTKPVTAWAVFYESIMHYTIRHSRKASISAFLKKSDTWVAAKKHGYTCRKIQITEAVK